MYAELGCVHLRMRNRFAVFDMSFAWFGVEGFARLQQAVHVECSVRASLIDIDSNLPPADSAIRSRGCIHVTTNCSLKTTSACSTLFILIRVICLILSWRILHVLPLNSGLCYEQWRLTRSADQEPELRYRFIELIISRCVALSRFASVRGAMPT